MSYNRPAHNKPRAKMASVQARTSRYHFALRRDSHGLQQRSSLWRKYRQWFDEHFPRSGSRADST